MAELDPEPVTPPASEPAIPPAAGPALTLNAWLRWDVVRRVLPDLPIRSVLEVGCGQGAVGARLATCYDYVGYEPDPESYARASARLDGRGRVHKGAVPKRPDRSDRPTGAEGSERGFDLVCAFEVLEHIEDDAAALAGWAAWLNPGGTLLVSVPAGPERFGSADEAVGHYRRYDPETVTDLLAGAGLMNQEVWTYGFPLGYALEVARNRMARRRPAAPRADRTAASGRWGQPPDSLGWITRWATLPFRLAQRPFTRSRLGTGLIASGRRPA